MRLEDYLSSENVTASEFARRIGRATSTVTRIARGEAVPEPETLARIVAASGGLVRPGDFFGAHGGAKHELPEEELLRARIYRLLACFLAAPPDAALFELTAALNGDASEFGLAIGRLALAAGGTEAQAARDEFHDLFIGIGRGELVPYGSYYITGFLNEKPLARLRADLARLGVERAEGMKEPEDGMAALCEVMAGLIDGSFGAPADLPAQHAFFAAHLAPWAVRFFEDLESAQSARLYAPVGTLGRLFMRIEETAFAMAAD